MSAGRDAAPGCEPGAGAKTCVQRPFSLYLSLATEASYRIEAAESILAGGLLGELDLEEVAGPVVALLASARHLLTELEAGSA